MMQTSEILSYFSGELFYILGIILNLIFFIFLKRKANIKRISDFVTAGVFILNLLIISGVALKNLILFSGLNFPLLNNFMFFSNENLFLKSLLNIFMLAFIFVTYKITRKARFKTPVINSILLFISLVSSVLIQMENFILTYLLFDILTVAIYKYASNMRIRKTDIYSSDYIFIGITASILFFAFYFITFFIKDTVQLNIIHTCMTVAFLLKAGIFPVSNYLVNRHYKTNLPYSILLFCFLPWMGVMTFAKLTQNLNSTDEIYQISIGAFLCVSLAAFSLIAFKQKNLVKFFANANYCFCIFSMLNILFNSSNNLSIAFSSMVAFCFLSLYSILCVLKINLKPEKFNISILRGLSRANAFFAFIFAILLLILTGVIPTGILKFGIEILKNVYVFDKISFLAALLIVASDVLIILNSLNIIQKLYSFDFKNMKEKFAKRTTLNYVVPCCVILILIINLFL